MNNLVGTNWTSINKEELNKYRISDHSRCYINKALTPDLQTYPLATNDPEVLVFKHGIKRSPGQFTLFKCKKYWNT